MKIALINGVALVLSFSNLERFLQISLLIISIIYTGLKSIELLKKKKNDKEF